MTAGKRDQDFCCSEKLYAHLNISAMDRCHYKKSPSNLLYVGMSVLKFASIFRNVLKTERASLLTRDRICWPKRYSSEPFLNEIGSATF